MMWLWVILGFTFGFAALGFGMEALFGNHDPGAVFPWMFVGLFDAFALGLIGFVIGVAADLLNLWVGWW